GLARALAARRRLLLGLAALPLLWLFAWAAAVLLTLAGSTRGVPLVRRLAGRPSLTRLAFAGNIAALVVGVVVAAAAGHALSLTRKDPGAAPVYLLYDDAIPVPRWAYALGLYRVALQATERWGPGSCVLAPLDQESLRQALRHGSVVVLACHGGEGYVRTPNLRITAPDVEGLAGGGEARCL